MKNKKIQIGIEEIQQIKMSAHEKNQMLDSILSTSIPKDEPIKSPYSFVFRIHKRQLAYYGTAFCLIVIVFGGGGSALKYIKNEMGNNTTNLAAITKERNGTNYQTFQNPTNPEENSNVNNDTVAYLEKNNLPPNFSNSEDSNTPVGGEVNNTPNNVATEIPPVAMSAPASSSIQSPGAGGRSGMMMFATNSSSITITSPNGGESFAAGQMITIKWETTNVDSSSGIWFHLDTIDGKHLENGDLVSSWTDALNTGEKTVTLPVNIPKGQYKIGATISQEIEDVSDNFFTIN
jgi:hypothetical protein